MESIARIADFARETGIKYEENAPMSQLTSFRIGGPADIVLEPAGEAELTAVIDVCRGSGAAAFPLGRGSNLLVGDGGIRGAVIKFGSRFSSIKLIEDDRIECEAGASLARLCGFALENGLSGLEFAYGIPGSVGGAVYMNAGAYGGEIKDVCTTAYYVREDGSKGVFAGDELDFSYRHSAFSGGGYYITKAVFQLTKGTGAEIKSRMDELLARRFEKQPMDVPSAGSTFKRPEGAYASALIDQCGLKGFRVGGAQVSEKHAGFVVNIGEASCEDVLGLIEAVKERVLEDTGFVLEPEVEMIGEQ